MDITIFLYVDDVLVLSTSYTQAKEDGQRVVLLFKTGFCVEPGEVPVGTHSRIYTPGSGVQYTEYDIVISPG